MLTNPSNVSIPRFPEDNQLDSDRNWRTYKRECILALKARSLLQYIEGTIVRPLFQTTQTAAPATTTTSSTTATTTTSTTPTQTPIWSSTPLYEEWTTRDATATSIIITNVRDPVGVGIEDDKSAAEIWKFLINKYEKRVEQRIHLADTALRSHTYEPELTTMEDHEKKMKNLLRTLKDYGGTCSNPQFHLIVVASLLLDWKQDTRNVPGTSSKDAFTFLHSLYLEKQQEHESSERDEKRVKALLVSHNTTAAAVEPQQPGRNSDLVCSNCGKRGHTIHHCWVKGRGAEGEGPKNWRVQRPNHSNSNSNANTNSVNAASVVADPEPSQLFVLSADSMDMSLPW
ncbi:hypothetical protein BT96DRAFT_941021 [Gymnopus androsaceus JB14]|uniref:CCHC-type domain-containing protein n=1 Tax=Gymnopus androsaceus JB14 TaxID=1447944 RepID=A0A6A4HKA3_9AGAR|nr:hypothetical protein BT96DRAFT_941021 [Gymnopus androsaceus JB14]